MPSKLRRENWNMSIKHALKQRIVLLAVKFIVDVLFKKAPPCTVLYDGKDVDAFSVGKGGFQSGVVTQHCTSHLFEGDFNSAFKKATCGSLIRFDGNFNRERFYFTCKLGKIAGATKGDFIFVGVSWGIAAYTVLEYTKSKSEFYFVDKWDGSIPSQGEGKKNSTYCRDIRLLQERFKKFSNVNYIVGHVPECLPEISSKRIAFMHFDIGLPDAAMATIEALWPRIVEGGIVVLDSFSMGEREDRHVYLNGLKKLKGQFEILNTLGGMAAIIKLPAMKTTARP
tara:strand:+ start:36 stop:884 length:849 start_codon:yes stop_codon:yes gene_type:complete